MVLLEANKNATITVNITNPAHIQTGERVVVSCHIQSCDPAYTATTADVLTDETTVYLDVVPPEVGQDGLPPQPGRTYAF